MIRWILIFIITFIIAGVSSPANAEEKKAEDQSTTETLVVTDEDKEIIEVIEMLSMMEFLEHMEFMQEIDLFMEENTNEKED